jgi:hypothetical protein
VDGLSSAFSGCVKSCIRLGRYAQVRSAHFYSAEVGGCALAGTKGLKSMSVDECPLPEPAPTAGPIVRRALAGPRDHLCAPRGALQT